MAYQTLFERLELKYFVTEATAQAIVQAIKPYCVSDEHNGEAGAGYSIRSLYLDSPSLACFRAKERSDPDRVKLRARVYDAAGPVSLEIKRKRGDVVWKERASVPRKDWSEYAQGFGPELKRGARALERFTRLAAELAAEPKVLIDYEREAYASTFDGYARVTFDRKVRALACESWNVDDTGERSTPVVVFDEEQPEARVVLELKCEQFMPRWMADLIHDFDLRRVGFSKYNTAMSMLLDPRLAAEALFWEVAHA